MALPLAVIGLSALSSFLGAIVVKIIEFVTERLVKRLVLAGILIAAVYQLVQSIMNPLAASAAAVVAMIPAWPAEYAPVLIPMGILKFCLTTIITGEILVAFTAWGVWLIKVVKGVPR